MENYGGREVPRGCEGWRQLDRYCRVDLQERGEAALMSPSNHITPLGILHLPIFTLTHCSRNLSLMLAGLSHDLNTLHKNHINHKTRTVTIILSTSDKLSPHPRHLHITELTRSRSQALPSSQSLPDALFSRSFIQSDIQLRKQSQTVSV